MPTTLHPAPGRVPGPDGFNSPTVAKSNSPSTDSGHNEELAVSAPP
ncbi:hypothetical protein [Streptomyces prunicolor]|uniref:Uncharacterized protein n=1 Tax=Streptomyces prunicolor TaxID=67348 RepID=A0ABU4F1Z1_9ACTN|nr:hypothetical protein [Streptomyces prunicolor]MDV7214597.1 hypothetical protein [Streptomyces prunicolor]